MNNNNISQLNTEKHYNFCKCNVYPCVKKTSLCKSDSDFLQACLYRDKVMNITCKNLNPKNTFIQNTDQGFNNKINFLGITYLQYYALVLFLIGTISAANFIATSLCIRQLYKNKEIVQNNSNKIEAIKQQVTLPCKVNIYNKTNFTSDENKENQTEDYIQDFHDQTQKNQKVFKAKDAYSQKLSLGLNLDFNSLDQKQPKKTKGIINPGFTGIHDFVYLPHDSFKSSKLRRKQKTKTEKTKPGSIKVENPIRLLEPGATNSFTPVTFEETSFTQDNSSASTLQETNSNQYEYEIIPEDLLSNTDTKKTTVSDSNVKDEKIKIPLLFLDELKSTQKSVANSLENSIKKQIEQIDENISDAESSA